MPMPNPNFVTRPAGQPARLRLYCFPYAGGNGNVFLSWQPDLLPGIEVCGIQMPGRAGRFTEPPLTSLDKLVEMLAQALSTQDPRVPFAFFGHSLGALVAFELARACRRYRLPTPALLVASGSDAPQHRGPDEKLYALEDDALIVALEDYDGTPPELLQHRELMTLALPAIRADFFMAAHYAYRPSLPLDLPITVLAGRQDPHVSCDDVVHWRKETSAASGLHWFEGRHFFINDERDAVLACLNETLAPVLDTAPAPRTFW
ncbi:MAG: thioesterase domain-containing protein [Pseudomonadota bacterium]